ncbi:C40 family peptidase [Kordia zhangzhouensis]|uniref:C40 family peptidase n=1 Tax=Kordia zhangzhouensis TaxID=1620405 RepID=UPI0006292A8C|nr:C40 family peptidase [Kordia zhangzhouensis]
MIRKFLLLLLSFFIFSCGSSKKVSSSSKRTKTKTVRVHSSSTKPFNKANAIVETALAYQGTRYKFGGTNRKGMDCSGLTYTAFRAHHIELPRVSYQQATKGKRIKLSAVQKGDLLFFQTNKNRKRINHVGLVIENSQGSIKFIHATTSKGVLISSLSERYWKNAFTEARRIL